MMKTRMRTRMMTLIWILKKGDLLQKVRKMIPRFLLHLIFLSGGYLKALLNMFVCIFLLKTTLNNAFK